MSDLPRGLTASLLIVLFFIVGVLLIVVVGNVVLDVALIVVAIPLGIGLSLWVQREGS